MWAAYRFPQCLPGKGSSHGAYPALLACLLLAERVCSCRLGWLFSFILMAAFSVGCGYLGVLFSKLGVAVPSAQAFDEIGAAALGKTGTRLVYSLVYTTIFIGMSNCRGIPQLS